MKDHKKDEMYISDKKIEKLSKKLAKAFSMSQEEATGLIYDEWDLVEDLFHEHTKVKVVFAHFVEEINYTYRIA